MEEKNIQELKEFRDLLNARQYSILKEKAAGMNESDLAEIMDSMEDEDMLKMFRLFPKELSADVFSQMDPDSQQYIITAMSEKEAGVIIDNLDSDDAADLLEEMPANVVHKILANARTDTRQDINHLLRYKDDSAGSVMTVEFVDLKENMTVSEALYRIRSLKMDCETADCCYVLDSKRVLLGAVSLRHLVFSRPEDIISELMDRDVISCTTSEDEERVANQFKKYDLTAMPVVDTESRLVGIITVDDVMDIMEKETTEDMERMAAIIPGDKAYLKTSVIETWKKRFPWLLLLMISATFTGKIITSYENALSAYVVLTAYIPMLMDTGGNAGSQASTEVVRALSLDQIGFRDFLKIVWKEMRVGLLCGVTLAGANFLKCVFFDGVSVTIAAVVCITIVCAIVLSKISASALTMLVDRAHLDPAVVASPMLTTIIDALSLMIYFSIATALLHIV